MNIKAFEEFRQICTLFAMENNLLVDCREIGNIWVANYRIFRNDRITTALKYISNLGVFLNHVGTQRKAVYGDWGEVCDAIAAERYERASELKKIKEAI